jgi:hypothetical protein
LTEATLAFAREEATGEPTRVIDLAALAESVCSDLADLGWNVTFAESGKVPYRCRPAALRRALRNLNRERRALRRLCPCQPRPVEGFVRDRHRG